MKNVIRQWGTALLLPACLMLSSGCHTDLLSKGRHTFSLIKDGEWIQPSPIPCPFKLPGTSLEIVSRNEEISIPAMRLRLTTPRKLLLIDSLNQLQGAVRITTPDEALQFVRLRTSFDTVYCWPDGIIQEVRNIDQAKEESTTSLDRAREVEFIQQGGFGSGYYAILSNRAFKAGGFSPAMLRSTNGGFEVIRWVWVDAFDSHDTVQKWRELVRPDGTYSREILISKPEPTLPDTTWVVPYRL